MFCFSSQICSKIQNYYPDLLLNSHIASTHATHPVPNIQLEMNHDVRCQEKTLYIIQVHKNTVDRIDTVWEQLMTGRRTVCRRVTQEGSSYKTAPLYLKHCSNLWWNKLRRCAVKMIKQNHTVPCYFTITWQTNFLRSCYNARLISPVLELWDWNHLLQKHVQSCSNWTKSSMMGPQLFSGWYQMTLGVFRCSQLFSDVFRLFSNCFPTMFSDCWILFKLN